MATFGRLLESLKTGEDARNHRIEMLKRIESITGAPTVLYAANTRASNAPSGLTSLSRDDKTGFADLVDATPGDRINIVLHSLGGSPDAAEQIVNLLRPRFDTVNFIIPNMAKSAATLLVLSGNRIYMDDRSELGPIDPQLGIPQSNGQTSFVPAQAIERGFQQAMDAIKADRPALLAYSPMLQKLDVWLLELCRTATAAGKELAERWLAQYMLATRDDAAELAKEIAERLADSGRYKSHGRPIGIVEALEMGLAVDDTRETPKLRDAIWGLYCNVELHMERMLAPAPCAKLFENASDVSIVRMMPMQLAVRRGDQSGAKPGPQPSPAPQGQQPNRAERRRSKK